MQSTRLNCVSETCGLFRFLWTFNASRSTRIGTYTIGDWSPISPSLLRELLVLSWLSLVTSSRYFPVLTRLGFSVRCRLCVPLLRQTVQDHLSYCTSEDIQQPTLHQQSSDHPTTTNSKLAPYFNSNYRKCSCNPKGCS